MPRRNINAGGTFRGGKSGHKRVHKGRGMGRRRASRLERSQTRSEARPPSRYAALHPRGPEREEVSTMPRKNESPAKPQKPKPSGGGK
jgi:hypothetical protein